MERQREGTRLRNTVLYKATEGVNKVPLISKVTTTLQGFETRLKTTVVMDLIGCSGKEMFCSLQSDSSMMSSTIRLVS